MNARVAAVSAGALAFVPLGTGTPQLKADAVTAAKIKNRTLTAAKFAPGQAVTPD